MIDDEGRLISGVGMDLEPWRPQTEVNSPQSVSKVNSDYIDRLTQISQQEGASEWLVAASRWATVMNDLLKGRAQIAEADAGTIRSLLGVIEERNADNFELHQLTQDIEERLQELVEGNYDNADSKEPSNSGALRDLLNEVKLIRLGLLARLAREGSKNLTPNERNDLTNRLGGIFQTIDSDLDISALSSSEQDLLNDLMEVMNESFSLIIDHSSEGLDKLYLHTSELNAQVDLDRKYLEEGSRQTILGLRKKISVLGGKLEICRKVAQNLEVGASSQELEGSDFQSSETAAEVLLRDMKKKLAELVDAKTNQDLEKLKTDSPGAHEALEAARMLLKETGGQNKEGAPSQKLLDKAQEVLGGLDEIKTANFSPELKNYLKKLKRQLKPLVPDMGEGLDAEPTLMPGEGEPKTDLELGAEFISKLESDLEGFKNQTADLVDQLDSIDESNPIPEMISDISEKIQSLLKITDKTEDELRSKTKYFESQLASAGSDVDRYQSVDAVLRSLSKHLDDCGQLRQDLGELTKVLWKKAALITYPFLADLLRLTHISGKDGVILREKYDLDHDKLSSTKPEERGLLSKLLFLKDMGEAIATFEQQVGELDLTDWQKAHLLQKFLDPTKERFASLVAQKDSVWSDELATVFPNHFDRSSDQSYAHLFDQIEALDLTNISSSNLSQYETLISAFETAQAALWADIQKMAQTHGLSNDLLPNLSSRAELVRDAIEKNKNIREESKSLIDSLSADIGAVREDLSEALGRNPVVLNNENYVLEKLFDRILDKIESIEEKVSSLPNSEEKERLKQELFELKMERLRVYYISIISCYIETITSYERVNKPIANYYSTNPQVIDAQVNSPIDRIIGSLERMGGREESLARQMKEKFALIKKWMGERVALYHSYHSIKTSVIGVNQAHRAFPDGDPGFHATNQMIENAMKFNYDPNQWPELKSPRETEPNPMAIQSSFRIRIGEALGEDEVEFNGATILDNDGEWATLQSHLSQNHIIMMMVNEAFAARKSANEGFPVSYLNFHQESVYENYQNLLKDGFVEKYVEEYAIPILVDEGYFLERMAAEKKSRSSEDLEKKKAKWANEEELRARREKLRRMMKDVTPDQIKQVIVAYLPTCLPQLLSDGSARISDSIRYAAHPDHNLSDQLRHTKDAVPLRGLMTMAPNGPGVWEIIDRAMEDVRTSADYRGIMGVVKRVYDLPATNIQQIVRDTVERYCTDNGIEKMRYRHLIEGRYATIEDDGMIDFTSPALVAMDKVKGGQIMGPDRLADELPAVVKTKFSERRVAPNYKGLRMPYSFLVVTTKDKTVPRTYKDTAENYGHIISYDRLVDEHGQLRFDLFSAEHMNGSLIDYYAHVGSKVGQVYSIIASDRGKMGTFVESIASNQKNMYYASGGFPGEKGRNCQMGYMDPEVQMAMLSETLLLADLFTMAFGGSEQAELDKAIDSVGIQLSPQSKEVISKIVNAVFTQPLLASQMVKSVSDQISKNLAFQN